MPHPSRCSGCCTEPEELAKWWEVMTLTQGRFPTEERLELHRNGWADSFEKLDAVLKARRNLDAGTAPKNDARAHGFTRRVIGFLPTGGPPGYDSKAALAQGEALRRLVLGSWLPILARWTPG